jgi:hypothetical protein
MNRFAFSATALVCLLFVFPALAQSVSLTAPPSGGAAVAPVDPQSKTVTPKAQKMDPSWIDPDTGFLKSPERLANPDKEVKHVAPWEIDQAKLENRLFLYQDRIIIERELGEAFNVTCGSRNIRVELDRESFLASPAARKNVRSYADAIQVSLKDICKDNRTRLAVAELLSIMKLVNNDKMLKPDAIGDIYTVTITYAFGTKFVLQAKELTPKLYAALQKMIKQYYERKDAIKSQAPVAVPEE